VLLHGALGDARATRDLLVGEAGSDAGHDLALAEGQRIDAPQVRAQPAAGAPSREHPAQKRGRPIHE
jgi:hypothetical protein